MPTALWIDVAEEAKLAEGVPKLVSPKGIGILLIKQDGAVYAIRNKCPHMGCPMESGELEDHVITCPCHGWSFDIRSGAFTRSDRIKVETYPVKVEDGQVAIDLDGVGE